MMKFLWIVSVLLLVFCCKSALCFYVTVDAHAEECFFEKVEKNTKLSLMFEISEGGFLDIDVKIVGPDDKILYQGERESSGKYTFSATLPGIYTYCFGNQMSTMTPKVVMFNMDVGEPPKEKHEGDKESADDDKMENVLNQLSLTLTSIKHEQDYMSVRDRIHRSINESTNSRVLLWSIFEAIVLITMTFGQIYYLKRFFEVRRVV